MSQAHLLVPLDGSDLAAAVLPIARTLAASTSAALTLCAAVPATAQPGRTRAPAEYLQDVAASLRVAGLTVHTTVRLGDPADAILELARECRVDLIVMATHGRTGLRRAVLGSVADRVLHASGVPVVLLRPNQHSLERLRTLLVPVDGSPGGSIALGLAVPLARASGAKLVLVRATVPLPLWLYDPTLGLNTGPLIDPMWDEDARHAAEVYPERLADRIRRVGVAAEGRGVSGQPGAVIVATAEEVAADLIVMSTHARTGPARAVLGSVANDVVRHAGRPVLLIRRQGPAVRAADARSEQTSGTAEGGSYEPSVAETARVSADRSV